MSSFFFFKSETRAALRTSCETANVSASGPSTPATTQHVGYTSVQDYSVSTTTTHTTKTTTPQNKKTIRKIDPRHRDYKGNEGVLHRVVTMSSDYRGPSVSSSGPKGRRSREVRDSWNHCLHVASCRWRSHKNKTLIF